MKDLSKLFEKSPPVQKAGGIFTFQPDEPSAPFVRRYLKLGERAILESQTQQETNRPYNIHVGFTSDDSVRPFAFEYSGNYFIAISWGTIAYLSYFFQLAVSYSEVLNEFGDAELERSPTSSLSKLNANLNDLFSAVDPMIWPRSASRKALGSYLCDIAFLYIVHHEICHVRHGHLGLLNEAFRQNQPLSDQDRHAMEFDCDCYASMKTLNLAMRVEQNLETILKIKITSSRPNRENSFYLHFFPIYLFFRVYFDEDSVYKSYSRPHHPPSFLRMFIPLTMAYTAFLESPLLSEEELQQNLNRIVDEAESTVARLTNQQKDLTGLGMATDPQGLKMMDDLRIYWGNLRPKLLKHSYSVLAP